LDAVAEPVRLPLEGDYQVQVALDSDDARWARARVEAPALDAQLPLSGAWLSAQGLPTPSLLVGQAILIEGRRV